MSTICDFLTDGRIESDFSQEVVDDDDDAVGQARSCRDKRLVCYSCGPCPTADPTAAEPAGSIERTAVSATGTDTPTTHCPTIAKSGTWRSMIPSTPIAPTTHIAGPNATPYRSAP